MLVMLNATSLVSIAFLVFLEGILSVDNALVLAVIARSLPKHLQRRALTFGVWGAFLFRALALFLLTWIMQVTWLRFVGGGYLIWMAAKHFTLGDSRQPEEAMNAWGFWRAVIAIELMDIAFSADSILASLSVSNNYWILLIGGCLGILTMRVAAQSFIWLINRYPRMETTAYLLVLVMGLKLTVQGFAIDWIDFHSIESPYAWVFWGAMAASIFYGLIRQKETVTFSKA